MDYSAPNDERIYLAPASTPGAMDAHISKGKDSNPLTRASLDDSILDQPGSLLVATFVFKNIGEAGPVLIVQA